jgi:hypothetical protein
MAAPSRWGIPWGHGGHPDRQGAALSGTHRRAARADHHVHRRRARHCHCHRAGVTMAPVLVEVADGIARLRFNRPEALNALDPAMSRAFVAAVRQVLADPGCRVVVLSGQGRGFVAGGDLAAFRAAPDKAAVALDIIPDFNAALLALAQARNRCWRCCTGRWLGRACRLPPWPIWRSRPMMPPLPWPIRAWPPRPIAVGHGPCRASWASARRWNWRCCRPRWMPPRRCGSAL